MMGRLWEHEHRLVPNRSRCFMCLAFRPFRLQPPGSSSRSPSHATPRRRELPRQRIRASPLATWLAERPGRIEFTIVRDWSLPRSGAGIDRASPLPAPSGAERSSVRRGIPGTNSRATIQRRSAARLGYPQARLCNSYKLQPRLCATASRSKNFSEFSTSGIGRSCAAWAACWQALAQSVWHASRFSESRSKNWEFWTSLSKFVAACIGNQASRHWERNPGGSCT